jgi:6-phospho-3-hexuloisomerase
MTPAELAAAADAVVGEIAAVVRRVDADALAALAAAIDDADRVFVAGQGRSGLVGAAVAVRLGHLGVRVHVTGEATCPAVGPGDLLVAISKSGTTTITLHQATRARAAGARVALVTRGGDPDADLALVVPLADVETRQHAGSLFEQSVLVLGDALCAVLQRARGLAGAQLAARHDNLQ